MSFTSWLSHRLRLFAQRRGLTKIVPGRTGVRRRLSHRLLLEQLEQRTVPTVTFTASSSTIVLKNNDVAPESFSGQAPIEPQITINPANPTQMVLSDQNGLQVSTDAGRTFPNSLIYPVASPGGDTSTVYDSTGRLFWANLAASPSTTAVVGGGPWLSVNVVEVDPTSGKQIGSTSTVSIPPLESTAAGSILDSDDKPFLATDGTNLFVAWDRFTTSGSEILLSEYTNTSTFATNLHAWSTPVVVQAPGAGYAWPSYLSVAPNGDVIVAYHYEPGNTLNYGGVLVATYSNSLSLISQSSPYAVGETLTLSDGTPIAIPGEAVRQSSYPGEPFPTSGGSGGTIGAAGPWILADPARPGSVYVFTSSAPTLYGTTQTASLKIASSGDYGQTWWSYRSQLGPGFELFPTAAIDKFGDMIVAWLDDSNSIATHRVNSAGNYLMDVYAEISTDGGTSWSQPFEVNDPTNPIDPQNVRLGDYFGASIFGNTGYVIWDGDTFSAQGTVTGQQAWMASFALPGSLTVADDSAANNQIIVQAVPGNSKALEILVNGATEYAGLAAGLSSINIQATAPGDAVQIGDLPQGISLNVVGAATVDIGNSTVGIDDIKGTVNIETHGSSSPTAITVDDSVDPNSRSLILSTLGANPADSEGNGDVWGQILNFPGTINYEYNDTSSLTVKTGGGLGGDTVDVLATGVPTNVICYADRSTVHVGDDFSSPSGVLNIREPVNISGGPGVHNLTIDVDDQPDSRPSLNPFLGTFTQTDGTLWGYISGLANGDISYAAAATSNFDINAGTGGANFLVLSTPAHPFASLPGSTLTGTTITSNGTNQVTVGVHSVAGIQGNLNLFNTQGKTTLIVDDSAEKGGRGYTQSSFIGPHDVDIDSDKMGRILFDNLAPINYEDQDTSSVTIKSDPGNNTEINVLASGVPTYLVNNGPTTVNVGNAGSLADIQGVLNVSNTGGFTTLNVDGSADNTPDTVRITASAITGLAPVELDYTTSQVSSMTIKGSAGSTYSVDSAGLQTAIDIQGSVARDFSIDDQSDSAPETYTITNTTVQRSGSAPIAYGNVQSLFVNGGSGANTYTIQSTAPAASVYLRTGSGQNGVVNLQANSSPVDIDTTGGHYNVSLGFNGIMAGIQALVNVHDSAGTGSAFLNLEDGGDLTSRTVTVNDGSITGLSPGTIQWTTAPNASVLGGVQGAWITGGSGGNTFNVNNTSDFYDFTFIAAGAGPNQVNIRGTTGALIVQSDNGGQNVVTAGSQAPALGSTMANIKGSVYIWDQTRTALTLDDSGDTSGGTKTVTFGFDGTYNTVSGLAPATFYYKSPATLGALYGVSQLNVYDGDGPTTFAVQSTGTGTPVTITTGPGNNTINVGNAQNQLDSIQGPLTINGGGNATLNVNDQSTATNQVYQISDHSVQRLTQVNNTYVPNIATISYSGIANLALYGGTGSNILYIDSTAAGTTTDVYGGTGSGADEFEAFLYSQQGPNTVQGPLHLHGQNGPGTGLPGESYAILYDYGNRSNQTYTFTSGALNRTGLAPVTYDHVVYDALYTSQTTTAAVNVLSNAANVANYIVAGPNDKVTLGSQAPNLGGTLAGILGPVLIEETAVGVLPSVVIDDSSDATLHSQVTFSANPNPYYNFLLTGLAPAPLYFALDSGAPVTVMGGNGGNTYDVEGVPAGIALALKTGTGTDTVNIGSNPSNLPQSIVDGIQGTVAISSAGSNTTVNFNDQGSSPGTAPGSVYYYNLTQNSFNREYADGTFTAAVTFADMAAVNLYAANAGNSGYNVMHVSSTAPGTTYSVYAGTGVNEFVVADSNYTLNGIQGALFLHGAGGGYPNDDLVDLYDVDKATRHTFRLTAGATSQSAVVQRFNTASGQPDMATIDYDGVNAYSVFYTAGGTGNAAGETFNVQSEAADSFLTFSLAGNDAVNIGNPTHTLAGILGDLRIQGGLGQKPIVTFDDSADSGTHALTLGNDAVSGYGYLVTGLLPQSSIGRGRVWLQLDPAAPVAINTGAGNDTFQVNDFIGSPSLAIDGGGGVNTLDYSAYHGTVQAILPLGLATGFGGGIKNIENVTGGQGNSLLVGDANANVLKGGTGRNLLIGGGGADTLDASGAGSDNILIGGTTDYDTNLAALNAVFAEWTRIDLGFRDRFSDLNSGTNGQSATPLNQVNGTLILLTNATVHADTSPDTLIGSSQTDPATGQRVHNWFFSDYDDTLVNFLSSSDHKTKVK